MKSFFNIIIISFFAICINAQASGLPQNIANLVEDSASAVVNITSRKEVSSQNSFRSMPPELERFLVYLEAMKRARSRKEKLRPMALVLYLIIITY